MERTGPDPAPGADGARADGRPLVVYDGACGLCREQVERLRRLTRGRLRFESFREPGFFDRHRELTPERCDAALQLIEPGKRGGPPRVREGADAVVRAASRNRILRVVLLPYWLPPIRLAARAAYRWVARNRFFLSRGCGDSGCPTHPPSPGGGAPPAPPPSAAGR